MVENKGSKIILKLVGNTKGKVLLTQIYHVITKQCVLYFGIDRHYHVKVTIIVNINFISQINGPFNCFEKKLIYTFNDSYRQVYTIHKSNYNTHEDRGNNSDIIKCKQLALN